MPAPSSPSFANEQPLEALRSLFPASTLSDGELRELVPLCRIARFEAGSTVIREGDASDSQVYFLLAGSVSVSINNNFILRLNNRGDIVGEMALISSGARSATVSADEPSIFLAINSALPFSEDESRSYKFRYFFSRLFNQIMSEKLRTTSDRAKLYEDAILHSRAVAEKSASLEDQVAQNLKQMRLLSHLVDSAMDTILIIDLRGRVQQANGGLGSAFGVSAEEVQGMPMTQLLGWPSDPDVTWTEIAKLVAPSGWRGEVMVSPPHHEPVPADCSVSRIQDAQGNLLAYSVILRDISQRKAYQERILRQRKQLEKAFESLKEMDRMKGHFLSLVSHELRTPISSILAYSESIAEGLIEPEQHVEFSRVIHQEAQQLNKVVSKVLAITKLESGQLLFNFQSGDLGALVKNLVEQAQPHAQQKGLSLRADVGLQPVLLKFDADQLREALAQLLDNALEFTEHGSVSIELRDGERQALLQIRDTGKGIDQGLIATLFNKFERTEQQGSQEHGLGLGLPLSQLIIKAHNGDLRIESAPGQGTTVVVTLPHQGDQPVAAS